jgi:hypothetical protein
MNGPNRLLRLGDWTIEINNERAALRKPVPHE